MFENRGRIIVPVEMPVDLLEDFKRTYAKHPEIRILEPDIAYEIPQSPIQEGKYDGSMSWQDEVTELRDMLDIVRGYQFSNDYINLNQESKKFYKIQARRHRKGYEHINLTNEELRDEVMKVFSDSVEKYEELSERPIQTRQRTKSAFNYIRLEGTLTPRELRFFIRRFQLDNGPRYEEAALEIEEVAPIAYSLLQGHTQLKSAIVRNLLTHQPHKIHKRF